MPSSVALFKQLPPEEWIKLQRSFWKPVIQLAEKVAYFHEPYGWLRHEYSGFSPEMRFIQDRRLSDDSFAEAALSGVVATARALQLKEPIDASLARVPGEFLESHREELARFEAMHYPWLARRSSVVDVFRVAEHPRTDDWIQKATISFLDSFGVKALKVVKRKGDAWRCQFELGGRIVRVSFEKGTRPWVRVHAYLEVSDFNAGCPLGYAFGFSNTSFFCSVDDDIERQLHLFYAAYQGLFRDFVAALELGIQDAGELSSRVTGSH